MADLNNILTTLSNEGLIQPPKWLIEDSQFLVIMGSNAYGVSSDTSDMDIYGWCIPPKRITLPHTAGFIPGFGPQGEVFGQWQQHHIHHEDREYDFSVYNVIKYFDLVANCNPNMIDSLFVPRRCVIKTTAIGEHVRANRKMFLSTKVLHSFKGYAFKQKHLMEVKNFPNSPKRAEDVEKHGYSTKFAYHLVRLLSELEQILEDGDLDLEHAPRREMMKAIRRGDWVLDDIQKWFADKERQVDRLAESSTLTKKVRWDEIRRLLYEVLEMRYGSLSAAEIADPNLASTVIQQLWDTLQSNKGKLGLQ